jgi:DNA polymerase-1
MPSFWERQRDPSCKDCSLHEATTRVCHVTGKGSINASVLFIVGPPDEEDEIKGIPMKGGKGQVLTRCLMKAEWTQPYSATPVVKCVPAARIGGHSATVKQIRACSKYIDETIKMMAPKLIICFGIEALKGVKGDPSWNLKNSRRRVRLIERSVLSKGPGRGERKCHIPVLVTYDPRKILKNPYYQSLVSEDLLWAKAILSGGDKIFPDTEENTYLLQGRDEDLGASFGATQPEAALDIETTTLSPWSSGARILCAAVAHQPNHATAFTLSTGHLREQFERVLASTSTTKIGHDILFDLTWLTAQGYKVQGDIFDTLIAFHMLSADYPDKSLSHLTRAFVPSMRDYEEKKSERGSFTSASEDLLEYCAADTDAAYRLKQILLFRLQRDGLLNPFQLRMECLRWLPGVQVAGLCVDTEVLDYQSERNRRDRIRVRRWFAESISPAFNPDSSPQVQDLLFRNLQLDPVRFSKDTGKPSADEAALKVIRQRLRHIQGRTASGGTGCENNGGDPGGGAEPLQIVEKILQYRDLAQEEKMFLGPWRDKHVHSDNHIHPSFNLAATVSGRWACRSPNMQQVPKGLRNVVVSRFPEGSIVRADASQMELRVLAHLSQEPALLEVFAAGGDVHTATASLIFHKKEGAVTDSERFLGKTINFATIYGMTAKSLGERTGMSTGEAKKFFDLYWEKLPAVDSWVRAVKRQIRLDGYAKSMFGVRRVFPLDGMDDYGKEKALREGVNHIVQSSASDITAVAFCEMSWHIQDLVSVIINIVHDEITADSPADEVQEYKKLVKKVCERPPLKRWGVELSVPLVWDVSSGPNWRDQE